MLEIRKKGNNNFFYKSTDFVNPYTASDLVIIFNGNTGFLRSESGREILNRDGWLFSNIIIYDETTTGAEEVFASVEELTQRLIDLGCPAFTTLGISDLNDFENQVNQDISGKTDKGGYSGTSQDLKDAIDNAIFGELVTYQTLAEFNAVTPVPADGTPFIIANDTNEANNGQWSVQGGVAVQNARTVENTIVPTNTTKGVTGQAVSQEFSAQLSNIGIFTAKSGENVLASLLSTDLDDTNVWAEGFYFSNGVVVASTSYRYTVVPLRITEGTFDYTFAISGNAAIVFFDKDNAFISGFVTGESGATDPEFTGTFTAPTNAYYIGISHYYTKPLSLINAAPQTDIFEVNNDAIFISEEQSNEISKDNLSDFGLNIFDIGDNLLKDLTESDITDTSIWGDGLLRDTGVPLVSGDYKYSLKYYPVAAGDFDLKGEFSGTARWLVYNSSKEIILDIANTTGTLYLETTVTLPEDAAFIRISTRGLSTSVAKIRFNTYQRLALSELNVETISKAEVNEETKALNSVALIDLEVKKSEHFRDKTKTAMVSFISDDGRIENDDWFIPILDAKDVKATFAIISNRFTNPDYWTKAQVIERYRDGHEIAGHTHTHPHLVQDGLTDAEIDYEIKRNYIELEALNVQPELFVHPYGDRNDVTRETVARYFSRSILDRYLVNGNVTNGYPFSRYEQARMNFDAAQNSTSTLQDCKDAVDLAVARDEWVCFTIHPQYPEYYETNPTYLQRRQDLEDLIDYVQSLDVPIVTTRVANKLYENKLEIGEKSFDGTNYYAIGSNGSTAGGYFGE